ncbi:MAG: 5-oxoprolinase subunit PxpA [Chitinophagales bacterium]|nr:5-oxoprolinase subunit PxpA [Chitinophagales bacterium]
MSIKTIDINCDLGEGVGNEAHLMPFISSCNIACGGHAGDEDSMKEVIGLAIKYNVKIGAHPSFPDREHFGRKFMDISSNDLLESLEKQILALKKLADALEVPVHHIKFHGALYNSSAKDAALARTCLFAIKNTLPNTFLYAPFGSAIAKEALLHNIKVKYEAFADRRYHNDLSLVSRKEKNAVIHDKKEVLQHLESMILNGQVKTVESDAVKIQAATFCVHGDTQNAVELIQYIYEELPRKGIQIV